jgi:small GTP-binding protein
MSQRKIMLLGEIGVGKSSLAKRLVTGNFSLDYKPTIGVDVYSWVVPDAPGLAGVEFIVWDTDGNFGDAMFRHVYMRRASAALIVGDARRRGTLDQMAKLADGFDAAFPGRHVGLVVNKIDLVDDPAGVDLPDALARREDLMLTSALTGYNVDQAFLRAAEVIVRRGL